MTSAVALRPVPTERPDESLLAAAYRGVLRAGGAAGCAELAAALRVPPAVAAQAVEALLADRLVRRTDDGRLVAVDPDIATAVLTSPLEQDIARRNQQIAAIRDRTERFREDYVTAAAAAADQTPAVTETVGDTEVDGLLAALAGRCHREFLVLKSGQRHEADLLDLLELCRPLLARGVDVRVVCQHRARAELTIRSGVRRLLEAGAGVRTQSHIPSSAIVVDGSTAVLLGSTGSTGSTAGTDSTVATATCVRGNPAILAFAEGMFRQAWETGTAVDPDGVGYGEVADDVQRSILELMARGFTDEVVARRLGMSVRSCRRHIATLLRELGAVSRFQAGVAASRCRLLDAG